MIIAVDFDGTLCVNEWPKIGRANMSTVDKLIDLRAAGHKVILWTCREGELLEQAVQWCILRGLEFDAVNENIIKTEGKDTRKVWADVYIDDKHMIHPVYFAKQEV